MSKREPLLSDELARIILKNCAYNPGSMNPVSETRAFYERLIDEGKLRVVEEVEWGRDEYGREVCSICMERSKELVSAGEPPLPLQWMLKSNKLPHCPLCGNSRKR